MTWINYTRYAQGYWIRYFKNLEGERLIAFYIAAAHRDPKKPFPRYPQQFMPFPTDVKIVVKQSVLTKEEYDAIINRYAGPGFTERKDRS